MTNLTKDYRNGNATLNIDGQQILSPEEIAELLEITTGSRLLLPFLRKEEIYDEQGRYLLDFSGCRTEKEKKERNKAFGNRIQDAISNTGYVNGRTSTTSTALIYLLGSDDHVSVEDALSSERAADQKALAGNRLRTLTEKKPIPEENIAELDAAMIRGTKRLCRRLNKLALDFAATGDFSPLLKRDNRLLVKIGFDILSDTFTARSGFFERYSKKKDPALEEVLDPLRSFCAFAGKVGNIQDNLRESIENPDRSATLISKMMEARLTADRIQQRRKLNRNASLKELYPTRQPAEKFHNENAPLDIDDELAVKVITDITGDRRYEPDRFCSFREQICDNPILLTGAAVLGMKGKLFRDIHYQVDEEDDDMFSEFRFRKQSLSAMRSAAYQSGIPAPMPIRIENELETAHRFFGLLKDAHVVNTTGIDGKTLASLRTLEKKMDEYRNNVPCGYIELKTVQKNCRDLKKLLSQNKGKFRDFQEPFDEMMEAMDRISNKAGKRCSLFEQGVRQPERTKALDSAETINERAVELKFLLKYLKDLQVSGMSPEWKMMRHALEQAEAVGRKIQTADGNEADHLMMLNASMRMLKESAHAYIVHKVNQKNWDSGTDRKRVELAARLESVSMRELQQSEPEMEKKFDEHLNSRNKAVKKDWLAERIGEISNGIANLEGKEKNPASEESLNTLRSRLGNIKKILQSFTSETFTKDVAQRLSEQYVKPACGEIDAYLQCKKESKEADSTSLRHILCAEQIRIYLENFDRYLNSPEPQMQKQPAQPAAGMAAGH